MTALLTGKSRHVWSLFRNWRPKSYLAYPRLLLDSLAQHVLCPSRGPARTENILTYLPHRKPAFWVPAVDVTSFENAYRDIGRLLGVAGIDDHKVEVKTVVKTTLNDNDAGQWLLIVDNGDDLKLMFGPTGLLTYLPSSMNGSILLTTRTRGVAVRLDVHPAGVIRTAKMSSEEATEMMQARLVKSQMQDTPSLAGLLDFLGDLPLAIRQASAFMHRTEMMTETGRYLEHCRSSDTTLVNLLSRDFEDRGRYDTIKNPVARTWLISFEHFSRDLKKPVEGREF